MGKKAARRQAAAMNEMNALAQEQFDYYKEQQGEAQIRVDEQRAQYEAFEFTNPFAGAQNVFAGAQNPYAGLTNQFAGLENMYEGMENRFEDMTVDMRAANFQVQQGQQQRANIMQGLRGAAGTSGVAGLAQSLANQGQLQSQQIAAGIGQQERQNRMLAAQEGARIDQLQRGTGMQLQQLQASGAQQLQAQQAAGAMQQQQMQMSGAAQQQAMILGGDAAVMQAEFGRESTLLGMEYGGLAGANAGLQGAMGNQMSGMGMQAQMYGSQSAAGAGIFGSILGAAASIGGSMILAGSDRDLKKNIKKIGESNDGTNIYEFKYKNPKKHGTGTYQGVIADDLSKKLYNEAVSKDKDGNEIVNYGKLDVEFKRT